MGAHQDKFRRHREAKRLQPQETSSLRLPMTNAREEAAPASRASLPQGVPLPWICERANRLHRFCKSVERRRAAGVSVRKAVEYFAWFWRDRTFQTAPLIKVRLSKSRLVVLYYEWCRGGRSPKCFLLNYGTRRPPVSQGQVRRFVRACGRAVSLAHAARLVGFQDGRAHRVLVRLPSRLVSKIRLWFRDRPRLAGQEQAAILALRRDLRRLQALPMRRAQALKKYAEACLPKRGAA